MFCLLINVFDVILLRKKGGELGLEDEVDQIPYSVEWFFGKLKLKESVLSNVSIYFVVKDNYEIELCKRHFKSSCLINCNLIFTEDQVLQLQKSQSYNSYQTVVISSDQYQELFKSANLSILIENLPLQLDLKCLVQDNTQITKVAKSNHNINFVFETLPQCVFLINHLIAAAGKNELYDLVGVANDFFSKSINVVYLLENKRIKKNYRKREIALSCSKCRYYSLNQFLVQCSSLTELVAMFNEYKIDSFLQRSPEFYFRYKEQALVLEKVITSLKLPLIDSFSLLDNFYNRINQAKFLEKVLSSYNTNVDSIDNSKKFQKILFPRTIIYDSSNFDTPKFITDNPISFPVILKPSYSGNHNMTIVYNYENLVVELNKIKSEESSIVIQELISLEY